MTKSELHPRSDTILDAAVVVFGRHGFRKTSMEDVATAAKISKQGLYLHFASKDDLFVAAMRKYLTDGLEMVQSALTQSNVPLVMRLVDAMDAWFGRHYSTFLPTSFDVIQAGSHLSGAEVEACKIAFQTRLAKAIAASPEYKATNNIATPKQIAGVLFQFGLTWKEGYASRADFMKSVGECVSVCCQLKLQQRVAR